MSAALDTKRIGKVLAYGALVAALYAALFANERQVMEWSRQGGWWFLLPVAIAFVFSLAHGNFTGEFWEMLGVRAKK